MLQQDYQAFRGGAALAKEDGRKTKK